MANLKSAEQYKATIQVCLETPGGVILWLAECVEEVLRQCGKKECYPCQEENSLRQKPTTLSTRFRRLAKPRRAGAGSATDEALASAKKHVSAMVCTLRLLERRIKRGSTMARVRQHPPRPCTAAAPGANTDAAEMQASAAARRRPSIERYVDDVSR